MAEPLGRQLASAVRQSLAEAAGYVALVTRTNPQGSADALLQRPDVDATLRQALDSSRQAAEEVVRQAWYDSGASASGDALLGHLLDDVGGIFGNLAHLHGLVRHAHAGVPQRHFTRGVTRPGANPQMEAAGERSDAVRDALLGWGRQAALRARMAAELAEGSGAAAAVLAGALRREAAGEQVMKRWRARTGSPSCCFWCRRLDGVTIALGDSFAPYLGGPAMLPGRTGRRVRTKAGERRYGLPAGSRISYTHPPRPYHGKLDGPLLHPFCHCRLEVVRAPRSGADVTSGSRRGEHGQGPAGFVSAAEVRGMPEDEYQGDLAFLRAAVTELDQVLKRLAGGSG